MQPTVHVIGAGLSGLAAALALDPARDRVVVHEAARHAGGRCRSYYDATLKLTIDNGNHLVLSGNTAVQEHLRTTGAEHKLTAPDGAAFDFVDVATGERWQVRPNAGPIPWWIFVPSRRVPGTRWTDYLGLAKLLRARGRATIGETMACEGLLYDRLWHPLLVAALNTEPRLSSAVLAGAVIRETLAKGGAACVPLIAAEGLGEAFVDPALATLESRGVEVGFDRRLRRLDMQEGRIAALEFADETIALGPQDRVILAVPGPVAGLLVPDLAVPTEYRSIVNAHFLVDPPDHLPGMLGMINSTAEWLFRFPGRLAVTVSDADRLLEMSREDLARLLWQEVATVTGLPQQLPPWQVIREKRATFAALPEQEDRRPGAVTRYANLFLAGDWTATGLPATIEGSLRSGKVAATAAQRNAA